MDQFEQLLANKWIVLGIFAFVFITSMTVNVFLERQRKRKRSQEAEESMAFAGPVEEPAYRVKLKPFDQIASAVKEPDYRRIQELEAELKIGPEYEYQENQLELVLLDIEECLRQLGISFDKGYFYFEQASGR